MKRVLVTGGCGFIGHRLVAECLNLGCEIAILDIATGYGVYDPIVHAGNLRSRRASMNAVSVESIDITDAPRVLGFFESFRPDTIIHLASVPIARLAVEQPLFVGAQMVHGTLALLEAARAVEVKRFVYASSSMTYGDFESDAIDETHRQRPREIYGSLKLACEHLVRNYTTLHGLAHTIIRPTAVYGPTGNEAFVLTRFVRAAKNGGCARVDGAETRLDFTFVDDTARGIALAANAAAAVNETFNIAYGQSRRLLDAAHILKSLSPSLEITVGERDALYPSRGTLNIDKARALLGFDPRYSLERGLEVFHAAL